MEYEKHTWTAGDFITTGRLNHIEDGIADAANTADSAKTTAELADGKISLANVNNFSVDADTDTESMDLIAAVESGEYRIIRASEDGTFGLYEKENESQTTATAVWKVDSKKIVTAEEKTASHGYTEYYCGGYIGTAGTILHFTVPALNSFAFDAIEITDARLTLVYSKAAVLKQVQVMQDGESIAPYTVSTTVGLLGTNFAVANETPFVSETDTSVPVGVLISLKYSVTRKEMSIHG